MIEDITKPEIMNKLVADLKKKFSGNKLVFIGVLEPGEQYLRVENRGSASIWTYPVTEPVEKWLTTRVEKCLLISPGKEYHFYVSRFIKSNGKILIKVADALLEKPIEPKRKRKLRSADPVKPIKSVRTTKPSTSKRKPDRAAPSRCPYDHFFED